jgi:hypothetical protein
MSFLDNKNYFNVFNDFNEKGSNYVKGLLLRQVAKKKRKKE